MLPFRGLLAALLLTATSAVAEEGPTEVIRRLNAGLEELLRDASHLDYQARYQRIAPLLDQAYDFEFMAHQAVGQEWDTLSADDQRRWVTAFGELTKATYASRMNRSSGQRFELLGEEPAAHETITVRSRVIDPAGENVDLTYRLKDQSSGWRVIDVYLKGTVSEVALRRSEYASVLKREGFDALLAAVNRKVAAFAAGQITDEQH